MKLSEQIIGWLREQLGKMGMDTAVIGISGGKDSAVAAALLAAAIGPENVYGVMMPNGVQRDIEDSRQVIAELGINSIYKDISAAYKGALDFGDALEVSTQAAINTAPRLRMTTLYCIAQSLGELHGKRACVIGTGNKAEIYVGYFTKWGDGAFDISPLKDLWVHEVLQVGDELGFFPKIIHKVPDDGLSGMTDEEKLGFSYDEVYRYATGDGEVAPEQAAKIERMHRLAAHKITPPPFFAR